MNIPSRSIRVKSNEQELKPDKEYRSDRNFRRKCSLIETNGAYLMCNTVQTSLLDKDQSSEFEEVLRISSEAANKHARLP